MTYELFLEQALELFEEKGYAATTIDDIATGGGLHPHDLLPALRVEGRADEALLATSTRSSSAPTTRPSRRWSSPVTAS